MAGVEIENLDRPPGADPARPGGRPGLLRAGAGHGAPGLRRGPPGAPLRAPEDQPASPSDAPPAAATAEPGTADLCFLTRTPLDQVAAQLAAWGVEVELGPVDETGAQGPLRALYCRDPDRSLIELSNRNREGDLWLTTAF